MRFLRILLQTLSVTLAFCVVIQAPAHGQTDESTKPERKTQAKNAQGEQDGPAPAPKYLIEPLKMPKASRMAPRQRLST